MVPVQCPLVFLKIPSQTKGFTRWCCIMAAPGVLHCYETLLAEAAFPELADIDFHCCQFSIMNRLLGPSKSDGEIE